LLALALTLAFVVFPSGVQAQYNPSTSGKSPFTNTNGNSLDAFYAALRQSQNQIIRIVSFGDSILACYQITPCTYGAYNPQNSPFIALRQELGKQYTQYSTGFRIPFRLVSSTTVDGGEGGYTLTSGTVSQSSIFGPQQTGFAYNGDATLTITSGGVLTIAVGQPYVSVNVYCVQTTSNTGWTVTIGGTVVGTACGTTASVTQGAVQNFSDATVTTATASAWSTSSTTLTVTTVATGTFGIGGTLSGTSVPAGTTILQQLTGTVGGAGTYQMSQSFTIATGSGTLTQTGGLVNSTLTLTATGASSYLGGYEAITTLGTSGIAVDNFGEAAIDNPFFAGATGQGWVNLLPGQIALGILEVGENDCQAANGPQTPAQVMASLQIIATNIQRLGGSVLMWIPPPFQNSATPAPYTAIQQEELVYSQAAGWDVLVMGDLFVGAGITSGYPNFNAQNVAATQMMNQAYGLLGSDNQHPSDLGGWLLFKQLYTHLFGRMPTAYFGQGIVYPSPPTVTLSGSYTNATTGFTPVTETASSLHPWQFQVGIQQTLHVRCEIAYSVSATTDGIILEVTGPGTPTNITQLFNWWTSATASNSLALNGTAYAVQIPTTGVANATATTIFTGQYIASITNGSTAGTVAVNAKGVGTGTLTIFAGSYCTAE
jgi:hypothetical protein